MQLRLWSGLVALGLVLAGCGGEKATDSVAGTYTLVKDQQLLDGVKATAMHDTGAASEEMLAQIQSMVDQMEMTVEIRADATFEVTGKMGGPIQASGSWTREGDQVVLTATHEDGKPREEPEVSRFILDGRTLRLPRNEKDQPFDLVLQRK